MNQIFNRFALPSVIIACAGLNLASAEPAALNIESNTPDVAIDARSGGRSLIRLPALKFEFRIDAFCHAGSSPTSVLLSIADTRTRLSAESLQSDDQIKLTMTVPEQQIPPLSIEPFCAIDDRQDHAAVESLTVRGALSLQASLLCESVDGQTISYSSKGLDVTLNCELPEVTSGADE